MGERFLCGILGACELYSGSVKSWLEGEYWWWYRTRSPALNVESEPELGVRGAHERSVRSIHLVRAWHKVCMVCSGGGAKCHCPILTLLLNSSVTCDLNVGHCFDRLRNI